MFRGVSWKKVSHMSGYRRLLPQLPLSHLLSQPTLRVSLHLTAHDFNTCASALHPRIPRGAYGRRKEVRCFHEHRPTPPPRRALPPTSARTVVR